MATDVPPGTDYYTWDWRQLETAIVGGADASKSDKATFGAEVSVPQTLIDAGNIFFNLAQAMTLALATFDYNVNALVGDGTNGPWKGDAAQAASDNFKFFHTAVSGQVDAINGRGDPSHAIYNQLWDAGYSLQWAINEINSIDA